MMLSGAFTTRKRQGKLRSAGNILYGVEIFSFSGICGEYLMQRMLFFTAACSAEHFEIQRVCLTYYQKLWYFNNAGVDPIVPDALSLVIH